MKMKARFKTASTVQRSRRLGRIASACALCWGTLSLIACSETHISDLTLSAQGLYRDSITRQPVSEAFEYEPDYPLWSDGVQKRRWLIIPDGAVIDTSDMDHWVFPVGTRVFKEFSQYGTLLETRLVERIADTGRFESDYKFATYVWDDEQAEAHEISTGVQNVLGTDHNVPPQKVCKDCHRGEPGAVLGVSAMQLSRSGLLQALADRKLLSVTPERKFLMPGDEITSEAAGYLHANCGHCHSDTGQSQSDMRLHISTAEVDGPVEETAWYQTTLAQRITEWKDRPASFEYRVVPGDPEHSGVYHRMTVRGDEEPAPDQMPPLASEKIHPAGLAVVKAWIAALARE